MEYEKGQGAWITYLNHKVRCIYSDIKQKYKPSSPPYSLEQGFGVFSKTLFAKENLGQSASTHSPITRLVSRPQEWGVVPDSGMTGEEKTSVATHPGADTPGRDSRLGGPDFQHVPKQNPQRGPRDL